MYGNIEEIIQDNAWIDSIHQGNFDEFALSLFRFQYAHTDIYRDYVKALGLKPEDIRQAGQIPFLPIHFFKTHPVLTRGKKAPVRFESSGTTGSVPSIHLVHRPDLYEAAFLHHFRHVYGPPENYTFLCLLPAYLERQHSSLVYMARELINRSGHAASGFYLDEWEKLAGVAAAQQQKKQPTILLGVTFALLDFAERYPMDLSALIVMETGGMKGRREEWTRAAVHDFLKAQWQLKTVHSEYGMTELLSQAYAGESGIFSPSGLMRASVREINDPLSNYAWGTGCLNITDLANIYSCAFIATEDLAKIYPDGTFEILGRMDHSALRGCSLMAL